MSEHIVYHIYQGGRLIGEVYLLHDRYINPVRKVRKGLICRRVGA